LKNKETALTDGTEHKGPWKAQWCWTRKHLSRPWNSYAYFRATVSLTAEPRRAVVRLSADARYALFVNARRVHHGPARSFPEHQSYDTIDLAQYLEVGANAICVIVHQFGVPTFFS
jgi:alpha-L-rhamnosidase